MSKSYRRISKRILGRAATSSAGWPRDSKAERVFSKRTQESFVFNATRQTAHGSHWTPTPQTKIRTGTHVLRNEPNDPFCPAAAGMNTITSLSRSILRNEPNWSFVFNHQILDHPQHPDQADRPRRHRSRDLCYF